MTLSLKTPWLLPLVLAFPLLALGAPPDLSPQIGLRENVPQVHALQGARVIPQSGTVIENATVLLRDGRIEAVGADLDLPEDARLWDLRGLTIYPGFIDACASLGRQRENPSSAAPTHWNDLVRAERTALEHLEISEDDLKKRRELGFAAAQILPPNGIFRGQGSLVQLSDPAHPGFALRPSAAHHLAFVTSSRDYPKSLMGCLALIRQTLSDAQWHREQSRTSRDLPVADRPGENNTLSALHPVIAGPRQPVYFHLGDEADLHRALSLAEAFNLKRVFVDPGYAYRQWQVLKPKRNQLILSVAFPQPPKVEDPDHALDVSLEELQHWESAPANAAVLQDHDIPFALSTVGLEDKLDTFWPNVRRAVRHGLKEETALAALTEEPARLLGESERLGTIAAGRIANLVVTSGNPFLDDKAEVRQVWIDGQPLLDTTEPVRSRLAGTWEAGWTGTSGPSRFTIDGDDKTLKLTVIEPQPDPAVEAKLSLTGHDALHLTLPGRLFDLESDDPVRLNGYHNTKTLVGQGILPDGRRFSWSARRIDSAPAPAPPQRPEAIEAPPFAQYPAGAYPGILPAANKEETPRRFVITNATIWTCAAQGVLENASLSVEDGRILAVGTDIPVPNDAAIIDAGGKHLTPGLIDCHSHTAISRGVNEGSHAVTCEVRIGDVIDPTDISIYRQLAGGLTTANVLHGSANPMGGQNQVIKLRWGQNAEGLKFEGAKPGVKFALGENVKQANWGEQFTTRYPQSRLGVEQIMRDTFMEAREYGEAKRRHAEQASERPFRTNLRLEAVLEILRGDRLVHIHSYRQDEILMFVRLAQEFGFTVGTFQHILEGYKVPDQLAEIGAGASSFSDWWAYKFEVYDAIPHNGALLHQAGVVTSFNSDDRELATRLNTEAAKAVKYGGVPPQEALKFVTLNPAKQLRIDHRVGSLEPGKDADLVLWSGPPLSTLSRCQTTWIEGQAYFDQAADADMRRWVSDERRRLVTKILAAPEKDKEKENEDKASDESPEASPSAPSSTLSLADRLRLLSPWGEYELIDYQKLYHDGQELHTCTGCYCDFR